ncbi:glycine--tRNA ligase subunit beta [Poseidonibacter ostreae]|uniref:Glycine--tRNA ligase beta subunit n=1 Tax=Poseidonibacter ostreae TaxID=2654171 RepID=A0A6L4WS45_9BACT|nr:glycine--tRNA ligase subunit beta [Poseidonibacter ostreae]KAB7887132.1 glycine--tRNA ligase subunit beta [Poseidonibacter ostreae]KAB7888638.1 glycine--tRNA ligase subunit beta [Poseidonibacter ostreae]KAB7892315.1 glycine--tRNA ligase subunit beta [Poseidonibacter ostreae]
MNKPLLIEIGVEELPAIPFLKELPNIEKKWSDILEKNRLLCDFEFYYTPRRLVLWHKNFQVSQEDSIVEQFGAPVKIAFKDGEPTGAALGFAKKCGVDVSELDKIDQGRGEVLYFKKEVKGSDSSDLLNDMVNEFMNSLNFGKSMRWGDRTDSFIRPIRSLSIILGEQIVEGELFGVKSSNFSFAHRMVSYEPFTYNFAGDYFAKLDNNGVILYPDERRERILSQMKEIEQRHSVKIDIDIELLDEVVAITEYPTALIGQFDVEFLELPEEVIVTSMKEHQRYFAVYKDGVLTNNFIVVSNSKTDDFGFIISGNEKVLRPRLADGMFFYKNDIANGLSNEGLKKLTFVEGLGSMDEKSEREAKIAAHLADIFDVPKKELVEKAVMLSKADLMSEMVFEFTELQGLMGYYYAKLAKEDELVYTALKEQYLPDGEDSELPSNTFSSVIALSYKLDNLMGLFSVGKIPTGSKDPFGLRRAAAGIVKIAMEHKLAIDLPKIIDALESNYKGLDKKQLIEFFNERLFKIFDVNPSVLKAVLGSGETDIYKISQKLCALNPIVQSDNFKESAATFKRVANIIKDLDINSTLTIDESLLEEDAEKELVSKYNEVTSKSYATYDEELEALFAMKPQLDNFFEKVFVNHEDEKIKTNRKNTIGLVYQAFRKIADIKEITI